MRAAKATKHSMWTQSKCSLAMMLNPLTSCCSSQNEIFSLLDEGLIIDCTLKHPVHSRQAECLEQQPHHFMPAGCLGAGRGEALLTAAAVLMGAAAGPAMPWPCSVRGTCMCNGLLRKGGAGFCGAWCKASASGSISIHRCVALASNPGKQQTLPYATTEGCMQQGRLKAKEQRS